MSSIKFFYKGANLYPMDEFGVVMLVYHDMKGDPLIICIREVSRGTIHVLNKTDEIYDVNYASWQNGKLAFVVMGSASKEIMDIVKGRTMEAYQMKRDS